MNEELEDDELKRLIRTEHQERWLKLMMLLCELEEKFGSRLNHFRFDEDGIVFKDDDDKLVRFGL